MSEVALNSEESCFTRSRRKSRVAWTAFHTRVKDAEVATACKFVSTVRQVMKFGVVLLWLMLSFHIPCFAFESRGKALKENMSLLVIKAFSESSVVGVAQLNSSRSASRSFYKSLLVTTSVTRHKNIFL